MRMKTKVYPLKVKTNKEIKYFLRPRVFLCYDERFVASLASLASAQQETRHILQKRENYGRPVSVLFCNSDKNIFLKQLGFFQLVSAQ